MKFKKFDSQGAALQFSKQECDNRNCSGITKYWYNVMEAVDGWYAVIHDDAEIDGATDTEPQWVGNEERSSN